MSDTSEAAVVQGVVEDIIIQNYITYTVLTVLFYDIGTLSYPNIFLYLMS